LATRANGSLQTYLANAAQAPGVLTPAWAPGATHGRAGGASERGGCALRRPVDPRAPWRLDVIRIDSHGLGRCRTWEAGPASVRIFSAAGLHFPSTVLVKVCTLLPRGGSVISCVPACSRVLSLPRTSLLLESCWTPPKDQSPVANFPFCTFWCHVGARCFSSCAISLHNCINSLSPSLLLGLCVWLGRRHHYPLQQSWAALCWQCMLAWLPVILTRNSHSPAPPTSLGGAPPMSFICLCADPIMQHGMLKLLK